MRQKLYDYLIQRPSGAPSAELLGLLFSAGPDSGTQPGHKVDFGSRFLHAALSADPRFSYDPATDRWYATVHTALQQPIHRTTFVVIDIETTGFKPGLAAITEVAAVRIANGLPSAEFHTLVNPGRRVPAAITQLTGITDDMVRDQPPIEVVLPQLQAFLGSAVVVAHNADFDLSFLNFEARRLLSAPLLNPSLCTLRLARRLLPGLRSRSLDAVAARLGVSHPVRHRALSDARTTADVLRVLLQQLASLGITTLGQLLDFQHTARDGRRFEFFVPRLALAHLPEGPGVYRMLDGEGRVLYIGKAKNLRRRVTSYFTNSSGHSDKVLALVRNVREVTYERTGSELEAALREAELIRTLKPPYNRLSKHLPRVAFLKLTVSNPYPRLALTAKPGSDRALYIGPFRSREFAEQAQRLLARLFGLRTCPGNLTPDPAFTPCLSGQIGTCAAPCTVRVSRQDYHAQVATFLRFLNGEETALLDSLVEKRDRLAADLRFEAAARLQQEIELLEQILHIHSRLHWIVTQVHAFLLLPGREPGTAQAYLVLNGRLIAAGAVRTRGDLQRFAVLTRERFAVDRNLPLRPEEIDSSVILAAWLRDRQGSQGAVFPIDGPSTLDNRLDEVESALGDLLRMGAPDDIAAPTWLERT
ncbi:MAG: exonuclease domain-containing protein [Candidatus Binatia bacterium]|nr:exonuclease domain-containing protein [Candidatus Binatia bacterium]